jgi:glycosyltransferase involved in cell wall biosynthesis
MSEAALVRSDERAAFAVVMLTFNEELNLPKALASIGGRAPVVIVDSESSDGSEAIARAHGAAWIVHPFVDYASQRNYALAQVKDRFRWIFFLDADEEFTPELWDEVQRVCAEDQVDGAYVRLDVRVIGHRLTHGEFSSSMVLRLMRPEKASFGRGINERVDDSALKITVLRTRLVHRDARPLAHLFVKHITYARKEALAYLDGVDRDRGLAGFGLRTKAGRMVGLRWGYNKLPLFVRPFAQGFRAVVLLGAWRDGLPGLMHAGMHALWYPMLIDLLIYEEKLRRSGVLARENAPRPG